MSHINYDNIENILADAGDVFKSNSPYPHLVIDGFLKDASYKRILESIPAPIPGQKSSDYMFAKNKFENPAFDEAASILSELRMELTSERFAKILCKIYGKSVFVDPNFVGGGLHQGGIDSYLDMHVDFSRHPTQRDWVRELNLLLYLNDEYDDSWGGHLEMINGKTDQKGRVAPIGNRMVIMQTNEFTFHGYNKINFPAGKYRTSIAAYAYSVDSDFDLIPDRTTIWRPESPGFAKSFIAKAMPNLVLLKRKLFGSSTAKRAKRSSDARSQSDD